MQVLAVRPFGVDDKEMVSLVGKLATLGCCVLLFLATQAERAHSPGNNVTAPPQHNQVSSTTIMESAAKDAFELRHDTDLRSFLSISLSVPNTFINWSHMAKAFIEMPALQKNCLATAVYFESRSESELGQLAVAMVVRNRVQTSNSSVCGVVYRGANRFNSCQFSFACDGKPDVIDDTKAWKASAYISELAIEGDFRALGESMQVLTIATNYHADYVSPKWSKQITRLAKIGRHIFYTERPEVRTVANRKNYI